MSKNDDIERIFYLVNKCKKCNLHISRKNTVFGEGNLDSCIMFIGEAPGKNEDLSGRPFVGRAGKIFDNLLNSIGLRRNDVYISNIIKCRPPKNRNPLKIEIQMCHKYIDMQMGIIRPKVIVLLGRYAISYIFNKFDLKIDNIYRIHGKIFYTDSSFGRIKIIPIYHPAAAIYNKKVKNLLAKDFKIINKNIWIYFIQSFSLQNQLIVFL